MKNEKKQLGIDLKYPEHKQETKCKLYIQYGLNRLTTKGKNIDLHHGVKLGNIEKILSKRNVGNIKKVAIMFPKKHAYQKGGVFVLYKAEGVN